MENTKIKTKFELTFQKQGNGLKNYRELGAIYSAHWGTLGRQHRVEGGRKRWASGSKKGALLAA